VLDVKVDVDEVDLSLHQIWGLMLLVGEERDEELAIPGWTWVDDLSKPSGA